MRKENRPYVIMQMGMSVDGRIAPRPDMTMFEPNPTDELLPDAASLWEKVSETIENEWHPQGGMLGSWSIVRKDAPLRELPEFHGNAEELYADYLPADIVSRTQGWSILVDGQGRCRNGYNGTENPGGYAIYIVSSSAPPDYLAFLRTKQIPYLMGGHEHADLPEALSKLHSMLGLRAVKLLGGGTLNGAMIREKLVDEIHLIVTPALFGGTRTPTLVDCEALAYGPTMPVLELLSSETQPNGLVWLHYKVHNKPVGKAEG